jgi:site-specific DNA-methyltransferase (cytosine-N4-specific)
MSRVATASASARVRRRTAFELACWDFPDSRGGRELHPYPARFIPQIPRQALELLAPDGPVLDPFCGSGTTLAEARRRGLASTGVDLNPIACLISRVRVQRWEPHDAAESMRHARALHRAALEADDAGPLASAIPRVDHWFDPWAQLGLAGAISYLDDVEDPIWRDRLATAISSVVVRVSKQESDTRYAAVEKRGDREHVALELGQAVVRVCEWLAANTTGYAEAPVEVLRRDALDLRPLRRHSFAAAIFSPPYPNAYEYWLYHKYRMYWLGFDPLSVRSAELGARPHYCKPNGLVAADFEAQMSTLFDQLRHALAPAAPVVVVVGDSTIRGEHVDNAALLERAARASGFGLEAHARRAIRAGRSSFNRAHSRGRRSEHLLLLQAPS